ncbi:MAG: hypothetical protein EZS28_026036 [Streblomastix strix]|uniref:Uncharacterized protein n=1 Tax=Streblomastix strix TaxID=222440 RepID=A0A5J4V722_9EUKA|nr:MAG: hypothetical protein EZS28_026036 [Streblomastix strix]
MVVLVEQVQNINQTITILQNLPQQYDQEQLDALLLLKADKIDIIDAYSKTEDNPLLLFKANKTKLIDAYCKSQTYAKDEVYSKTETDEILDFNANIADIVDRYSKTEDDTLQLALKDNGIGELVLLHSILHSNRLRKIFDYFIDKISLLSYVAGQSPLSELKQLGYDLTENEFRGAKDRYKRRIYSVLSNDTRELKTSGIRQSKINEIGQVLEQFTSECSLHSKSRMNPTEKNLSEIKHKDYYLKEIVIQKQELKDNKMKKDIVNNEIDKDNEDKEIVKDNGDKEIEKDNDGKGIKKDIADKEIEKDNEDTKISIKEIQFFKGNIQEPSTIIDECERCLRLEFML